MIFSCWASSFFCRDAFILSKTTDPQNLCTTLSNTQLTLSWTPLPDFGTLFPFFQKSCGFSFFKVCVYENLNVETRPRDRQTEREGGGRSATETERGEGARPGGGVGQGREGGGVPSSAQQGSLARLSPIQRTLEP